jgi:fructose-bisphosphate aldolase, class I
MLRAYPAMLYIIYQENCLILIVDPKILVDGPHGIECCAYVTKMVLTACCKALNEHHMLIEGSLLKHNMVTFGSDSAKITLEVIAEYIVHAL